MAEASDDEGELETPARRGRGRPRKTPDEGELEAPARRGRGRPRKTPALPEDQASGRKRKRVAGGPGEDVGGGKRARGAGASAGGKKRPGFFESALQKIYATFSARDGLRKGDTSRTLRQRRLAMKRDGQR